MTQGFLPLSQKEAAALGWGTPDFVYVTGDAYIDHPSFGVAIISRVLDEAGFRVAILSQPDYRSCEAFKEFGRPRLGFLVSSGNIDSMVAHYTVAKRKRNYDYYSPGGKMGKRPDRAVIVYCNRIREAYGDVPIIIGGLEASLRRFAHYDYWDDKVRRSVLVDARADILSYGMGEKSLVQIAKLLDKGVPVKKIRDVCGTAYLCSRQERVPENAVVFFDYDILKTDKKAYADAFALQYKENDHVRGRTVVEYYGDKMLIQNPPMAPLTREELDRVYALPYQRNYHPSYEKEGGVPAIAEVKFSITHNRGCFGACNFCAIAFHQGRSVTSRSIESVVREATLITQFPDFKGYIHDIGGPTANFRYASCDRQAKYGVCAERKCLSPKPCPHLKVDHSEYDELLSQVERIPKIKKVFIRSGIRFDYLIYDKSDAFFHRLVDKNVSGQLKVAPEHCSNNVLSHMGKPSIEVYNRFRDKFFNITKKIGKEQYLVPYLMSSHPGSRLEDAVELALYLKKNNMNPEQVQDFYPTPGTASTVMYYTGYDPFTKKEVYVATDYEEKLMQRALLQFRKKENADKIYRALQRCGRTDLIGYGADCLIPPPQGQRHTPRTAENSGHSAGNQYKADGRKNRKAGSASSAARVSHQPSSGTPLKYTPTGKSGKNHETGRKDTTSRIKKTGSTTRKKLH